MSKKYGTFSGELLTAIGEATGLFTWPIEGTDGWTQKQIRQERKKTIYDSLYNLKKQNLVAVISKNGKQFYKLTKKGELETLLLKACKNRKTKEQWDKKWRMVVFDIPEDTKDKRDKLRRLLVINNFIKLQASVYISPFSLNREAVEYLKKTGLIDYIRFAKIEELDDDSDFRRKFKLQ